MTAITGYPYPDWEVQNQTTDVAEFQLIRPDGPVVRGQMMGGSVLLAITLPPGSMYTEVFPLGREIRGLVIERVRYYVKQHPGPWRIRGCYPDGIPGRREQWMPAGPGLFYRIVRPRYQTTMLNTAVIAPPPGVGHKIVNAPAATPCAPPK